MTELQTGSEAWWAGKSGPEWVRDGGSWQVTFWWRDPEGKATMSAYRHVWLCITGITDHHHAGPPLTLHHQPDSDIWSVTLPLPAHWRGSYSFIPSKNKHDFPDTVFQQVPPDPQAIREGWQRLLPSAVADPLNPFSWQGGRGHAVSGLAMPDAPSQPGWDDVPVRYPAPVVLNWQSKRLQTTRRVWLFTPGEAQGQKRPLAVLLDGQFWAESMPVWPALSRLTASGALPPAAYVLIDVIDSEHRSRELPCYQPFWEALQEELSPQIAALTVLSGEADRTVVAGQSFGGLSALYAGLHWPERFGCVLSQSGSFWWPDRRGTQPGWLTERLLKGDLQAGGLRIILQAGQYEPLIFRTNEVIRRALTDAELLIWSPVTGGHDALCWRGGLTEGLQTFWSSQPAC